MTKEFSRDTQTPPVPAESLADAAYRALEELIVTLELAPGSAVTEGVLNERVALGRTPVREAIQRLAWEGLLEIRPRAGIRIAPLVDADWIKVIDARRGVEGVLARSAAAHIDAETVKGFARAALAMQAAVAKADAKSFLAADKSFDEALALAADNPYAARIAAPLQTHSRRFWFAHAKPGSLAEAALHHIDLINAIISRDGDLAEQESRRLMALLAQMAQRSLRQPA